MKIGILRENKEESRVALTPSTVAKLARNGHQLWVERNAGAAAFCTDAEYQEAGATPSSVNQIFAQAEVLVKIHPPSKKEIGQLNQNQLLICHLGVAEKPQIAEQIAARGAQALALEYIPRISRAQSMDILSSQANIAGYRAVLEAVYYLPRAVPMMMTAAGSVRAAKVLVMGAGVAGLQAIATAKRLGAMVSATDVRPATKEQVESLAAKFVAVEDEEFLQAQTSGGYAKAMSADYQQKQAQLIAETIKTQDMVITTAAIPGKKAPQLINRQMVESMRAGSVIADLAAASGGNCSLTRVGKIIHHQNVTIIGHKEWAGLTPQTTSELFSNNISSLLNLLDDDSRLKLNLEDEIIDKSLVVYQGAVRIQQAATK